MEDYNKRAEENLLEMKKQKEEADQKMLKLEVVIGYISSITFFVINIYLAKKVC